MLILLILSAFDGLATAQVTCIAADPALSIPSCTTACFSTNVCAGNDCLCASNLKGWCEMTGGDGPSNWFSRWGFCVVKDCPDDGDITDLMKIFTAQCEGTVGGPLTNETVPAPLKDWMPPSTATATSISSAVASSAPAVSLSTSQSVASVTVTKTSATDRTANVLDDKSSASSQATNTAISSSGNAKPALSIGAIIGVVIGGLVLLALIIGLAFFFLRRRKRSNISRPISPPSYDLTAGKVVYDKPELDGQALEYRYSAVDGGATIDQPMEYAELDAGSPTNPVRELAGSARPA